MRWRRTGQLERLQLTPVYVFGLLTFLLATASLAGARRTPLGGPPSPPRRCCRSPSWPGCCAATWRAWTPTCAHAWRSCGPPARGSSRPVTPSAGASSATCTTAPRRGLWASPCCSASRAGASTPTPRRPGILIDRALVELKASLAELRELARGIHPAVLTERGLEPALHALASRAPVPVAVETDGERAPPRPGRDRRVLRGGRGAGQRRQVRPGDGGHGGRQAGERIGHRDVTDDGIGGADAAQGSGLRGLGDRVAALDGTLSLDSPPGHGTRLHVEIPCAVARRVRRSGPGHPLGQVMRAASRQMSSVRMPWANSAARSRRTPIASVGEGLSRPLSAALAPSSPNSCPPCRASVRPSV